jgi:hypothetical protein
MKKLVLILSGLLVLCGCGGGGSSKPALSVSISPSTQVAIDQGQTLNFTASVANDSSGAGVTWSMSGTGCTGAVCGTFSGGTTSAATYNAPASVSAKMTVTIVATSVKDTTKSMSSTVVVNPAPSITTTSLTSGTVGTAYTATLAATGGAGTLSWTLASGSSLPAGLSLSTSGAISGTPTTAASSTFTVKVTDSSGAQGGPASATQQLTIAISAPPPLTITTSSLPGGVVGTAYTATVQATGGVGTISWTLASGSLPAGLSMSTSGAISGTPTTVATSTFTVKATDSSPAPGGPSSVTQQLTIAVKAAATLTITTTSLSSGVVGTAYSTTLQSTGGAGEITWTLTSGSLPTGLSLSTSGTISGTPTAAGNPSFTVTATDSSIPHQTANQQLSILIQSAPLVVGTTSLPSGTVNTLYSEPLQASGGTAPYTWTVTSGSSLPSWLSISGSGSSWKIGGTPTAAGTSKFSLTVTDSSTPQQSASQSLTVIINAAAVCSDSGSESLLAGQYAFMLGGYSESGFLAAIGSFTADGAGKIIAGTIDSNGTIVQSAASIDTTRSFYNVGSNYLGCVTLVTSSGTFTTRISVGGVSSGVATEGRMVEWDDATNPNYLTATGQLFMQSVPANLPTGKYTYELGGVYGSSNEYRTGVVGVVSLEAGSSGGAINGGEYDINVEGTINDGNGTAKPYSGMTGTYTALDPTTGRFTDTATIGNETDHHVGYALSGSQYLQLSTDTLAENTAVLVGKAQAHSGNQTLTAGTNLVYYATGTSSAEIGIINITNSTSYSATYYEDVSGSAEPTQNPTCAFTIDTYARVTTSGATCTMYLTNYSKMYPPVFYFYDSTYGVMLGTGVGVYIGSVEPQVAPSGGFSSSSVAGTYFDGDNEVVNGGVSEEMIGVEALKFDGSGGVAIVGDYIGSYTGTDVVQEADSTSTGTLGTVNSNGTFSTNATYGQINAVMISTGKIVNIDNATKPDPIIQVIKPVIPES